MFSKTWVDEVGGVEAGAAWRFRVGFIEEDDAKHDSNKTEEEREEEEEEEEESLVTPPNAVLPL